MEHTESQNRIIAEHLLGGKSLTSLEALELCGCLRLSGRIHDLRGRGMPISTEMVEINGKRVARYSMSADDASVASSGGF